MGEAELVHGSFRDPSGFLFRREGVLYRQVNEAYGNTYDRLIESGLYQALVDEGLLIPHLEVSPSLAAASGAHRILQPEPLSFISYPYEWCFSQLQDAALVTLSIQKRALEHDMVLKDASAYNVQFHRGRPLFIDTLSFDSYVEGQPWIAYRQFCQHFLAPLAVMSYVDVRLGQLLRTYIDGMPLDLASRLLPARTGARFSLLAHIHLHAKSQKRHADDARSGERARSSRVRRAGLVGLVESLESAVRNLSWKSGGSEWGDYYEETNYSEMSRNHKADLIRRFLDCTKPDTLWDLGGNTGVYSRLGVDHGAEVVSWDTDPAAVEKNYLRQREESAPPLLPLVLDLANPSGGIGWANAERMSLAERGPVDVVMALALIHHLAISNNLPLDRIAEFLSRLGRFLIIEFVPKADSQVKRLLATREDIFPNYTRAGFEKAFAPWFQIREVEPIRDSTRLLYLCERR